MGTVISPGAPSPTALTIISTHLVKGFQAPSAATVMSIESCHYLSVGPQASPSPSLSNGLPAHAMRLAHWALPATA